MICRSLGLIETFRWAEIHTNENGMHTSSVQDHRRDSMKDLVVHSEEKFQFPT